jgi:hypothetical protein
MQAAEEVSHRPDIPQDDRGNDSDAENDDELFTYTFIKRADRVREYFVFHLKV